MTASLTAAFIPGVEGVSVAGVGDDGSTILAEISGENAEALSRQLINALAERCRFRATLPGHVGAEGE